MQIQHDLLYAIQYMYAESAGKRRKTKEKNPRLLLSQCCCQFQKIPCNRHLEVLAQRNDYRANSGRILFEVEKFFHNGCIVSKFFAAFQER
ncbi:MAG TPA: hypothetical protein DDW14_06610 [Spirochaetaceae bacterium]|nr:hypothetical protein [Spirochaetaceae bacterium]